MTSRLASVRTPLLAAFAASALVVNAAAPVSASTGGYAGGAVTLTADPGEALNVSVWFAATGFFDQTDVLGMTTGAAPIGFSGCANAAWAQQRGEVSCHSTPVSTMRIDAGTATASTHVTAYATTSPTTIEVDASRTSGGGSLEAYSPGVVSLSGGAGDDWLDLGARDMAAAALTARAGAGKDQVHVVNDGPAAVLTVDGGSGPDDVSFSGSAASGAIDLGDDDDSYANYGVAAGGVRVSGGAGNDVFETMNGPVRLDGGPGDDLFEPDQNPIPPLSGGVPADPRPGDVIYGGPGTDTVELGGTGRDNPVRISLDGKGNDGERGEKDNYHPDVEVVKVLAVRAVLIGSKRAETLVLGAGGKADGKGGKDDLSGSGKLVGGAGNDRLSGGLVMVGGSGKDVFVGNGDTLTIKARDGERDRIRCSRDSATVVYADREDVVNKHHCRKVIVR